MSVQARLVSALDYVEKVVRLGHKVTPDIDGHVGKPYYEHDLAGLPGVSQSGELGTARSWLKIDRLRKQRSPLPEPSIEDWLEHDPDSLKEPAVIESRLVTMPSVDAAALLSSGLTTETDILVNLADANKRDVTLRLSSFPEIRAQCEEFIANRWKPWQLQEARRRRTIQIYDGLFNVHKQAQQEGAEFPLELVFCLGLARQKIGELRINTPVIEQLVEIEVGPDAALHVLPRAVEPIALLEPYANHDMAQSDLVTQAARRHFAENLQHDRELHPSERQTYWPILAMASVHLAKNGRFLGQEREDPSDRSLPNVGDELIVTDTWAIVVRRRSDNFLIQDIERLREATKNLDEARIPEPVRKIVEKPDLVEVTPEELDFRGALSGHKRLGGLTSGSATGSSSRTGSADTSRHEDAESFNVGTDLYFPLPFNDQQVDVMTCLEVRGAKGLVVQGPPGTGKSHTIANIICHFLAKGRRVLVTSKGERALEVLQDKLPPAVRALTVSLLANDQRGLRQLEGAVGLLADRVANVDPDDLLREIGGDQQELVQVDREVHQVDTRIRELARDQLVPPPPDLATTLKVTSNSELAVWSAGNAQRYSWFSDRPELMSWPVPESDVAAIDEGRLLWSRLGPAVADVGQSAPETDALPPAERLVAAHADLRAATDIERQLQAGTLVRLLHSDPNRIDKARRARNALAEVIAVADHRRHPWMANLLRNWLDAGARPPDNAPFLEALRALENCLSLRDEVLRHAIEGINARDVDSDVRVAIARAATGRNPVGWLMGSGLRAKLRAVRVNGGAPDTQGWRHTAMVLQAHSDTKAAVLRWNTIALMHEVPPISAKDHSELIQELVGMFREMEDVASSIRRVLMLHDQHVPSLRADLISVLPEIGSVETLLADREQAASALRLVDLSLSRERLSESRRQVAEWRKLATGYSAGIAKRIRDFLVNDVGHPSHENEQIFRQWECLLGELTVFHENVPRLARLLEIGEVLRNLGASHLATRLTSPATDHSEGPFPADWADAWLWAVVQRYLDGLDQRDTLRLSSQRRVELEHRRRQLLEKIVGNATEYTLALKIRRNPSIGAALTTFAAMVRKMGQGRGIRAPRMRRAARDAMVSANVAVPCWIMPQWRVSEMLPSEIGSFDLVIFDEASQSDIMALPAMMRGKKVLIVGDDKQVSPGAEFIDESTIRQLLHTYLHDLPHKNLMLPGSSLYDLGGVMYPGSRIMLVEHFRCVEPIIGFSQRFYKTVGQLNQIIPVRIPRHSERLDPPLIDVRIQDGVKSSKVNRQEIEFIVEEIESIVGDPTMVGRSIGVVSMVGSDQAHTIAKSLLDRLGAETYEKFHIACGDSATFQGDERDIIFLSMVHSPGQATSLSGLAWEQRFNVAVSRARDRAYLVRSIDKADVNSNGLQYALIDYFERPEGTSNTEVTNLRMLCESPFEIEVYDRLTELGYRVTPQVRSGRFRIDLVAEGAGDRRLAIELDGDRSHGPDRWFEDFARQQVLERVGWRFWRCFASAWHRDPKGMLGALVNELHRMGIEPHVDFKSAAALSQIVQHRSWLSSDGRKRAEENRVAVLAKSPPTIDVPKETRERQASPASIEPRVDSHVEYLSAEQVEPTDGVFRRSMRDVDGTAGQPASSGNGIDVGDKVAIQYSDGGRIYTIMISDRVHDTDNGVWKIGHPMADALLGYGEHDVVEIATPQGTKTATILGIQKAAQQLAI